MTPRAAELVAEIIDRIEGRPYRTGRPPLPTVRVVETLAKMRVEEWVELGGGGVLTRMLRDFELPSLRGITFEDLRARLYVGPRTFCQANNRLQEAGA